jgi:hypothetical protein
MAPHTAATKKADGCGQVAARHTYSREASNISGSAMPRVTGDIVLFSAPAEGDA